MWLTGCEGDVIGSLRKLCELALLSRLRKLEFPLDRQLRRVLRRHGPELETAVGTVALLVGMRPDSSVIRGVLGQVVSSNKVNWDRTSFEDIMGIYAEMATPFSLASKTHGEWRSTLASLLLSNWKALVFNIMWVRAADRARQPQATQAQRIAEDLGNVGKCIFATVSPRLKLPGSSLLLREALQHWILLAHDEKRSAELDATVGEAHGALALLTSDH